ncbi:MAG: hypothetical protein CVV44_21410 [Spirochaetae bacterium HGW-Spirochaetae-1]|jgi:uncharacterized protein YgiM (DUF1202 family)|nr:MAG: hypothetical protein CVV44_21410 [Spirochaetae bacterium HGW-Spirochaetae-1]
MKILKLVLFVSLILFQDNFIKADENEFVIAIADNINVRSEPTTSSSILSKVYITKQVMILKRKGKKIKLGDIEGEWIFIDTRSYAKGTKSTVKGWAFDYYFAKINDFKKMDSFKSCSIEGVVGDYLLSYKFNDNGAYKRKIYNAESGKYDFIGGHLYRLKDVVAAIDADKKYELFYFTPKGILCSQQYDETGQICSQCKDK